MGSVLLHDVPVLRHVRAQLLHLLVGRAVPGCDLGPQVVHVLARDHSASGPPRGPHDGQDDGGGCDPQVCRFCRSMPCARLFRLLRETPPRAQLRRAGCGRRLALGLRGRRGQPRTRRATGATRCPRADAPSPPPPAAATARRIAASKARPLCRHRHGRYRWPEPFT